MSAARFADYFLALAEEHEPLLRTREQLRAIALFDAEHDNLVSALRAAVDAGDALTASRFVGAMFWYWGIRGMSTPFETFMAERAPVRRRAARPGTRAAFSVVRLMAGSLVSEASRCVR